MVNLVIRVLNAERNEEEVDANKAAVDVVASVQTNPTSNLEAGRVEASMVNASIATRRDIAKMNAGRNNEMTKRATRPM